MTIGSMYHNLVSIVVVLVNISPGRYPSLLAGALIIVTVAYTRLCNLSASP
ncbi:MAG: hypothetical protein QF734_01090 [Arenicellales bacterium]|nr:hypothetical protein [Arenicellales bacterium]MDP7191870.1 hypothetical protein [Arenicellales bacterium]MDP7490900.1 hypothetical protein [Arenicellales bacterium]